MKTGRNYTTTVFNLLICLKMKKEWRSLSMSEPVLLFPKPKHFKWLKENKVLNGVLDFKIPNKMTEIMNKVHFQGRLNQLIGNDNRVRIQVQVVNNSDL